MALLITLLAVPAAGDAQLVCIKEVASAPVIDGVVASGLPSTGCTPDAVWGGVSPGEFQPGASVPQAHLYLAFHPGTSTLAAGITVHGDEDLSDQDYVSLFFDADNNNTWNEGDFVVRVQVGVPASKIESGIACDQATGNVSYFEHTGEGWVEVSPPATIQARVAYDFDTGADPDDKLWNLEVGLSVGPGAFDLQTTTPFFGIGGYVFVDDGRQQAPQLGTVRKWPGSITASPQITDIDPAFSEPDADELANASLAETCFDVNFSASDPWKINNEAAQAFDEHIDRDAVNTFTVTFFFDGPGDTPSPMPNVGTVRLRLRPYGTLATTGTAYDWEDVVEVDAETMNADKSVSFTFDFANTPASWSDFGTINFICATMFLEDFDRDDDDTNNSLNVNHNEFTTSLYTQSIFLSADGVPDLGPGERTTLLLRATTNNAAPGASLFDLDGAALPVGGTPGAGNTVLAGLIFTLLFLVAVRYRHSRRVVWTASVVLLLGVSTTCHVIRQQDTGWSFANARDLGLRPVAGQPGWYTLPIREGEVRRLEVDFEDMRLPYETRTMRLEPAGDEQEGMLRLRVEPGQVIGLFASGAVDLDGPDGRLRPTSANGVVQQRTRQRFRLPEGHYRPNEHAGALIGSFDGFRTGFPVGRSSTLIVPEQATTLSLAVNLPLDQLEAVTGAFDIAVIERPPLQVPTFPTVGGDGTFAAPLRVNSWDVLTSLNVYTFFETTQLDDEGRVVSRTRHPLGFAHQTVFDTHESMEETGQIRD